MKSTFKDMDGIYHQCGDFLIPEIALPDAPRNPDGKYGRMRHHYLKEHRGVLYNAMILDGTLWSHLVEVDKTCKDRLDVLVLSMKDESILTILYEGHEDLQGCNREIKDDSMSCTVGIPLAESDRIINPVCPLCRDHEQSGFIHGVQVGARLAQEVWEYANGPSPN